MMIMIIIITKVIVRMVIIITIILIIENYTTYGLQVQKQKFGSFDTS